MSAALRQRPDKGIRYHVAQVVSCQRAGCAHCTAHEESAAYLERVQREAVTRQSARRAAQGEGEPW